MSKINFRNNVIFRVKTLKLKKPNNHRPVIVATWELLLPFPTFRDKVVHEICEIVPVLTLNHLLVQRNARLKHLRLTYPHYLQKEKAENFYSLCIKFQQSQRACKSYCGHTINEMIPMLATYSSGIH